MLLLSEIISRLKFIGNIQINDKLDLKNMNIVHDSLYTQISRTVFQDNRNKSLTFIQDTISKSFEILRCYDKSKKNSEKIMCLNIMSDLKIAKNGLRNLKETYLHDIKFCCDIDVLLQTIDLKLSETDSEIFLSLTSPTSQLPFSDNIVNNKDE